MVALLPILMVVSFVVGLFQRPIQRTRTDVASVLERFLYNEITDEEWDDFICIPIQDSELERIRTQCEKLSIDYPPEIEGRNTNKQGEELLKMFITQLRGDLSSTSRQTDGGQAS